MSKKTLPVLVKKLRKYQKERALSQEKLARRLGFSLMAVNGWFMGKHHPAWRAQQRIRKLLAYGKK